MLVKKLLFLRKERGGWNGGVIKGEGFFKLRGKRDVGHPHGTSRKTFKSGGRGLKKEGVWRRVTESFKERLLMGKEALGSIRHERQKTKKTPLKEINCGI